MDMLHAWMFAQRDLVSDSSAISRTLDYSLNRRAAWSRYLNDGAVPIDNNWAENQIGHGCLDAKTAFLRVVAQLKTSCSNREPDSAGTHERA